MILNKLSEAEKLQSIHPGFTAAFDFLKRPDLAELPVGTYEIDGKRIYTMIQEYEGRGKVAATLETHKRYIDIQYTISGDELIGYRHAYECIPDPEGWNDENDVCFFNDKSNFWLPVPPGSLAIFFPGEDAHAPMAGIGAVRKVVIKIAAS